MLSLRPLTLEFLVFFYLDDWIPLWFQHDCWSSSRYVYFPGIWKEQGRGGEGGQSLKRFMDLMD